jgi:hypothetical protein
MKCWELRVQNKDFKQNIGHVKILINPHPSTNSCFDHWDSGFQTVFSHNLETPESATQKEVERVSL